MRSTRSIIVYVLVGSAIVLGSACVTSNASRCNNNNLVCPSGMTCSPSGEQCVDIDLVDACRGNDDGQSCNVPGLPPATCLAGICQASRCGDDRVTGAEECDGNALNARTCQTLGFYDKPGLQCTADCRYDASQCVGRCGDGIKNGREQCDGADLGGATCFTAGFYKAPGLACKADCTFDVQACSGGRCGDSLINGLEQCDSMNFNNKTCASLGFLGAMSGLSCSSRCTYTTQSCLCATGIRCKAKTQRCDCSKFGGCGCVAVQ